MQQVLGQEGRYRAVRRIDAGGMGEIWEADDALLGRRVAIKVLAEELADDREVMEDEAHQPFQEVPDQWNARVDAFWRQLEARA